MFNRLLNRKKNKAPEAKALAVPSSAPDIFKIGLLGEAKNKNVVIEFFGKDEKAAANIYLQTVQHSIFSILKIQFRMVDYARIPQHIHGFAPSFAGNIRLFLICADDEKIIGKEIVRLSAIKKCEKVIVTTTLTPELIAVASKNGIGIVESTTQDLKDTFIRSYCKHAETISDDVIDYLSSSPVQKDSDYITQIGQVLFPGVSYQKEIVTTIAEYTGDRITEKGVIRPGKP